MNKIVSDSNLPELYEQNRRDVVDARPVSGEKAGRAEAHEKVELLSRTGGTRVRKPVPIYLRLLHKVKPKNPLEIDVEELHLLAGLSSEDLSTELVALYSKLAELEEQQPSEVNARALDVLADYISGLEYINVYRYGLEEEAI